MNDYERSLRNIKPGGVLHHDINGNCLEHKYLEEAVRKANAFDEIRRSLKTKEYLFSSDVDKTFEIIKQKLSRLEKLEKSIEILNRIYGFKLQDIKFSGFYELLIPDMTSDELTKEEYELLKEILEDAKLV